MLKIGLIGIGFMGRTHLEHYFTLAGELPFRLTSICDIDKKKFDNIFVEGNLDAGNQTYDFSKYNLYTSIDDMLEHESLDIVDICLPTDLHREATVKALSKGIHVLCEKPMALSSDDCDAMVAASERYGKTLMIGQCLRFWPEYEYLKACVEDGRYGGVKSGTFFRGGGPPIWSYDNWMLNKERSGGCMLDMHIHDVDMVNWLFGMPESVSAIGKVVIPGSGYDVVSAHYRYPDGKIIHARGDWTLNQKVGFRMSFEVDFEGATLVYENFKLTVHPASGESFSPELPNEFGHIREIRAFIQHVSQGKPLSAATPQSTADSIRIGLAEVRSADRAGEWVSLT